MLTDLKPGLLGTLRLVTSVALLVAARISLLGIMPLWQGAIPILPRLLPVVSEVAT